MEDVIVHFLKVLLLIIPIGSYCFIYLIIYIYMNDLIENANFILSCIYV